MMVGGFTLVKIDTSRVLWQSFHAMKDIEDRDLFGWVVAMATPGL